MLRVGLLGEGSCGQLRLDNWAKVEGTRFIGFYDPSGKISSKEADKSGIRQFDNPSDLIGSCDIVDIATPDRHFEFCKDAILKSKHVFVQSPMAASMAEAEEILKLVREANVKFQVSYPDRFNPAYLAALEYIHQPELIEVLRVVPFNSTEYKNDLILDLMIHDIDLVLSIIKSNVRTIRANGVDILKDTTGVSNARIQFDNGSVAVITASRIGMSPIEKMDIFQKNTHIEINLNDCKTRIKRFEDDYKNIYPAKAYTANSRGVVHIITPEIKDSNAMEEELKSFVSAIKNNTTTLVDEWAGYRSLQVAHQITDQIKKHKFV